MTWPSRWCVSHVKSLLPIRSISWPLDLGSSLSVFASTEPSFHFYLGGFWLLGSLSKVFIAFKQLVTASSDFLGFLQPRPRLMIHLECHPDCELLRQEVCLHLISLTLTDKVSVHSRCPVMVEPVNLHWWEMRRHMFEGGDMVVEHPFWRWGCGEVQAEISFISAFPDSFPLALPPSPTSLPKVMSSTSMPCDNIITGAVLSLRDTVLSTN